MANRDIKPLRLIVVGLCLTYAVGCSRSAQDTSSSAAASNTAPASNTAEVQKPQDDRAEPKSPEAKSVDPQVQSEIEKREAKLRAGLLADAVSALAATRSALTALDKGDKSSALAALEQATGKLDLVVSRDPKLAFAPVEVSTTIHDLYATPDTVKGVVKDAKADLANNQVQQARHLLADLASEADTNVVEIPLATYPAAIKAVAPLIDAGKTEQAKVALQAALNTLVIVSYVVPLPGVRAQALLQQAEQLAAKRNRTQDDNQKVHSYINATRTQLQLAQTLGYGTKDDYKPLYAQLDDVEKKEEGGQSGTGLFAKMEHSLKNFKFSN
jgi:ribosomal protein S20